MKNNFAFIVILGALSLTACKKQHPLNESNFSGDNKMNAYLYERVVTHESFPVSKLKALKTKITPLDGGDKIITFDADYEKNSNKCKVWTLVSKEKKAKGYYTRNCGVNFDEKNNIVPLSLVKTHKEFPKTETIATFSEYSKPLSEIGKLRGKYDKDIFPLMTQVNVVLNTQKDKGLLTQEEYDQKVKETVNKIGLAQGAWKKNTALAQERLIKANMVYQKLLKEVSEMSTSEQESYKAHNFKKFNEELKKRL